MRKEPVDQLTVRAAPLDPVTITDQPHTLPHQPSPGTPDLSVNPPAPRCGTSAVRACRRAEGRLTGIFFSVIQKKVVTPGDFASLGQLSATLLGFADRYNQTARPFSWKFTAADLHDLMDRISRHEQQEAPQGQPLPNAA